MAYLTLNKEKLKYNYQKIDRFFEEHDIDWSVVAKVLCGNKKYLEQVIDLGVKQICDSRLSNLEMIKSIDPTIETIYIKPPAKANIARIVEFADISFNTEFETIKLLSLAAKEFNKTHKIVVMVELGELREGVMREQFVEFYSKVFTLPNIEVMGIGANLTCLYGVLPNQDKLIQLCLYKELVEAKFKRKISYVSGGTSVTIPLIKKGLLPSGINHFRVGETFYLGTDVYHNTVLESMHNDVFKLCAEIIELTEKPMIPTGEFGLNLTGETPVFDQKNAGINSYRAIVDIGLLDIEVKHLSPVDPTMEIVGASSDMTIIDLGSNLQQYKVGDTIEFKVDYMGLLRLMNSTYIEKMFEDEVNVFQLAYQN